MWEGFFFKLCLRCCNLDKSLITITYFNDQSIGAVNTIVRRRDDGKLVGYNTDCEAAIVAMEDALQVPKLLSSYAFTSNSCK